MIDAFLKYSFPVCGILLMLLLAVLIIMEMIEAKKLDEFNKKKGGNK